MCGVNIYKDDKSINDCDDGIWILFDYKFILYIINGMNKTYYWIINTQKRSDWLGAKT